MTVSNQTNRTSAVGTGAEQVVPFTFPITSNSDITVTARVITSGVETELAETTDYTIVNNGDSGGSITTVTPFIASTSQIHIVRDTPNTQILDLEQGGNFNAERIEDAFDKNAKLTIENNDGLDRTLKFPTTDPASSFADMPNSIERANKNLTFDSEGRPTASVEAITGDVNFSPIGTNIAEASDAEAVRDLIELGTSDSVEFAGITGTTGTFNNVISKGPLHDVTAYGAVAGGAADTNATAIQAAIDAAELVQGIVLFPGGVYEIDTKLDVGQPIAIWGPTAQIKQAGLANLDYILKIDMTTKQPIHVDISVDGNRDNNTQIEGIVFKDFASNHVGINVHATECDIGIVIEGNVESSILHLSVDNCTVGVLERKDTGVSPATPDENILVIAGHSNNTHYEKQSFGEQLTSTIHFACEGSATESGVAACIIDGGHTVINGILRSCGGTGVQLKSGNALFNGLKMIGENLGWAILAGENAEIGQILGTVDATGFGGGIWMKRCSHSSLYLMSRSNDITSAVRLGDTALGLTANRFHLLPGSVLNSVTGPIIDFQESNFSYIDTTLITSGDNSGIEFGEGSSGDTVRINIGNQGLDNTVNASAANPNIEVYGGATVFQFPDVDVDTTPSILVGNVMRTGSVAGTVTDFTDISSGKEFTVHSRGDIVYEFGGDGNLRGSNTNIATEAGDITTWVCTTGSTATLKSWIDVDQNNSSDTTGLYGETTP